MPVYNGENYISEAIRSILDQTYTDFELIITDNASTDRTPEIVESFKAQDDRIIYVKNDGNIGAAANYNRGYDLARGDFLKWCAHDDRISANYIEVCLKALEDNPDISLAFGSTIGIDPEGHELPAVGLETPSLDHDDADCRFADAIHLTGTCFPIFGLFRMSALKKSTLHRSYYGSDRALLVETAVLGKMVRVDEAVFYNREHITRSINIDDKLVRSQWQNGTASRTAAAEHINLTRHLMEIAGRHGPEVSPWKLRKRLMAYALHPRQIGRYVLETISIASPRAARWLKSLATPFKRRKSQVS